MVSKLRLKPLYGTLVLDVTRYCGCYLAVEMGAPGMLSITYLRLVRCGLGWECLEDCYL